MATDFLKMMMEESKAKKEPSKKETVKEDQQPQKTEKVAETKAETPKTEQKQEDKPAKTVEKKPTASGESYEYPFSLYSEGATIDISEYGFEDGKSYTPSEINKIMLSHRHYEFAGEMTYKMFEDDNMLVATAKQYKKG